ncbi:MAG: sodium:proton antiporter [Pseudomonadota bacterium]
MKIFQIGAILLTLSALFSFINTRYLRLPSTIGLMLMALLASLGLIALGALQPEVKTWAAWFLHGIDFNQTLLHGMLGFLLFAGALHVNLEDLIKHRWIIATLATAGVMASTVIIGVLGWIMLGALGLNLSLMHCLLFGALISPTDPIAVLGILKTHQVPKSLETKIAGESLFNDGVGVVVFLVLLEIVVGEAPVGINHVLALFMREALGGALLGFVLGWLAYILLKQINAYQTEILITLALATGGYALAEAIHCSAPIAVVVAGLFIGNHGRTFAMSNKTREHLDLFWELVDEILNAVLFVLIGLEVMVLSFASHQRLAALLMIPLVLLARFLSVGAPILILRQFRTLAPHATKVLTWGGLRGGISVALALSLPNGPERETILTITYAVVVFSILVQGLTIGILLKKTLPAITARPFNEVGPE